MPAINAGLEVGDQPVRIDDQEIYSFAQLVSYLSSTEANQTISFTVRKGGENGEEMTYQLTPLREKSVKVVRQPPN